MFFESVSSVEDNRTFLVEGEQTFTFNDVFEQGDALYQGLPRAVVLLLLDRSHEAVAAYLGALRCGMVAMIADAAITQQALDAAIGAYRPAFIVAPVETSLEAYDAFRPIGSKVLFMARRHETYPIEPNLALLVPTSGSTGDPKCVRLTAANIDACTEAVTSYLAMSSARVSLTLLPLHYAYGLSVLHNAVASRSKLVLSENSVLDPALWGQVAEMGVTDLAGVPFTFEMMRRMRLSDTVLSKLRCVTQAGGRLDPSTTRHFLEYFTSHSVDYFTMYGQTEAGPRISYLAPQHGLEKLGSVGRAIACGRVGIGESGLEVGEGELLYAGKNVCMGYAYGWADLARGDDLKGRLLTGDQASIDQNGFITIIGRKKRFVKLHGISVNLDHAEAVLQSKGFECMVVGQDNSLQVFVREAQLAATQEAVRASFNFHPSQVKIVARETLPRTAAGKPDYMALMEQGA